MEKAENIRIAGIIRESIVDGPGIRFVIFCQGCPHGYDCSTDRILEEIDKNPLLKGVTFSGGEPMCKAKEFSYLAEEIKKRGLDLVVFTGYTYEKLIEENDPDRMKLLEFTDLLIDGPYLKDQRDLTLRFRGSRNQRIIDISKTEKKGEPVLAEEYM